MSKVPQEIAGFSVLPVTLPTTPAFPHQVKHYLYIRSHDPKIPDANATRSLFVVNLPVTTSELHLKHLFTQQLEGGHIEKICFSDGVSGGRTPWLSAPSSSTASSSLMRSSRKRKRLTAHEMESGLDTFSLPKTFDSRINAGGSSAVVVFVDVPAKDLTMKTVKRAAKTKTDLLWGNGIQERVPRLGLTRYLHHNHMQYPSRKELLRSADDYMTVFAQMEETRSRENAKRRQEPDEEGFVTVTRGSRGGFGKDQEAEMVERQERNRKKKSSEGLENFYRFQLREKRKEQQGEMLRRFEEDRKKVDEMRHRRRMA